jgi:hypothetical protein
MNYIKILDLDTKLQLLCKCDFFAIGRPDIMKCYCCGLNNKYGTYTFNANIDKYDYINICNDYNNLKKNYQQWTYAPEIQLYEGLFEYCENNNLDINESMQDPLSNTNENELKDKNFCYLVR